MTTGRRSGFLSHFLSAASVVGALVCGLAAAAGPARADEWPAQVRATYDINFNGVNIGSYEFTSIQQGQTYHMSGSTKVTLLLGAINVAGATQATGQVAGLSALPKSFSYNYVVLSKAETTNVAFTGDTVTQVLHDPPRKPKADMVPVEPKHLKGVLDPLSAVLAITHVSAANPCSNRLPIYDGGQRYDIVLTPKGRTTIKDRKPNGQPNIGYVCKVRYVPIAGYRPDELTKSMAHNTDIELVLRFLPSANIFVPHVISVPTMFGSVTLTAHQFNITTNTQQQLAFRR